MPIPDIDTKGGFDDRLKRALAVEKKKRDKLTGDPKEVRDLIEESEKMRARARALRGK